MCISTGILFCFNENFDKIKQQKLKEISSQPVNDLEDKNQIFNFKDLIIFIFIVNFIKLCSKNI